MTDSQMISTPPESYANFRRGQLLLLLSMFNDPLTIDRIGYLEFFAANPHLIVRDEGAIELQIAGFNPEALTYESAPERFANRRSRLRTDLAALTARGYASPGMDDGRIVVELTERGRQRAHELSSVYADAYRTSISIIRRTILRLSDAALGREAKRWLAGSEQRLDLLDVALDAQLSSPSQDDQGPSV